MFLDWQKRDEQGNQLPKARVYDSHGRRIVDVTACDTMAGNVVQKIRSVDFESTHPAPLRVVWEPTERLSESNPTIMLQAVMWAIFGFIGSFAALVAFGLLGGF